jgi:hypothetical protein
MENQTQKSGDFLTSGNWNPEKYSIQFKKILFEKIWLVEKGVDANKDVSVTLHMPQVSAYLGMKISWC